MVWQMASDYVPFKGMTKDEFTRKVARCNDRPLMDRKWPREFCNLLSRCWDQNPTKRPSFGEVIPLLSEMMQKYK